MSPGSGVVTYYLSESGVIPPLIQLGFDIVGYGCMTCIGNSGGLDENIVNAIEQNDLVCCGVLSGNRNFEGRIHPNTRANYLASPLLVIAYAIAGRVDIDFETEPLGKRADGSDVYLKEIWPTRSEIHEVEKRHVIPAMFKEVYEKIEVGSEKWQTLNAPAGKSPQLPVYLYYLTLIKTCIIRLRVKLQIIFYLVLKKITFSQIFVRQIVSMVGRIHLHQKTAVFQWNDPGPASNQTYYRR